MSSSSNTTIVVQYDLYKTNMNYSICINTPNIIHNIKFTNLPISSQRKHTQNKYIETPQKEIIILNNNNTSMYWWICMIIILFLFSLFIVSIVN
jgi:hypothetical protein